MRFVLFIVSFPPRVNPPKSTKKRRKGKKNPLDGVNKNRSSKHEKETKRGIQAGKIHNLPPCRCGEISFESFLRRTAAKRRVEFAEEWWMSQSWFRRELEERAKQENPKKRNIVAPLLVNRLLAVSEAPSCRCGKKEVLEAVSWRPVRKVCFLETISNSR